PGLLGAQRMPRITRSPGAAIRLSERPPKQAGAQAKGGRIFRAGPRGSELAYTSVGSFLLYRFGSLLVLGGRVAMCPIGILLRRPFVVPPFFIQLDPLHHPE